MKLSVIIVNYNVKHFLEQCLYSVRKASQRTDTEVLVIDNNSVDGSVKMIKERFPEILLIENKENLGFSKANNQGIRKASGEYILLLNPDTVVEDDTFEKTIAFMDQHPEAGGLGVKMFDGKGRFLPESKRSLPTPAVAFYKISGLSKLFPRSRTFGRYHLGFLDKEKVHEVEVLAGAFMLLRKEVLEKTGLLDETFFMYGEDIDLSYRIAKTGYKNYYFPEARIIHYKGESTKIHSVNYVYVFYNAMIIFARKHFSKKSARTFALLINIAIYLRASVALLSRYLRNAFLPLIDAIIMFGGIFLIKEYWEYFIFQSGGSYPLEFIIIAVPAYIFIWIFSVYLNGGYDIPIKLNKNVQGMIVGSIIILVIYALLSESYRFSRALIILGASWGIVSIIITRFVLHKLKIKRYRLGISENRRFVVVGEKEEAGRVTELIRKSYVNPGFIGLVNISEENTKDEGFIGVITQISDILEIYKIDELIFCSKDLSAQRIIDTMSDLQHKEVDFKIAHPESLSIIGSNSVNTTGDLYITEINSINNTRNKRNKRSFDIILSLIFLLSYPISLFVVKKPLRFLLNIFIVLLGQKSWIGYKVTNDTEMFTLPKIKKGILFPVDAYKNKTITNTAIYKLNMLYARDYKVMNDLSIIYNGFSSLGRK
ncbi:glycosyltransferase family 2 protein [Bacteroidota bacterium]